jgi:endonuclease G
MREMLRVNRMKYAVALALLVLACSTVPIHEQRIERIEIPALLPDETVVTHSGFSLSYNRSHKQANWVAYVLTQPKTQRVVRRTDKFVADPKLDWDTVFDREYAGSGYDRGHLAPAADMAWSSTSMTESFYYSNISPQVPAFNRGIWKKLEEQVRAWAVEYHVIYVVTGPVLRDTLETIGLKKISVPKYFYKVIVDYFEPEKKGIGFILPNEGSREPLQRYAVTIDSVEAFTGIDFFPALLDDEEAVLEGTLDLDSWKWGMPTGEGEVLEEISDSTSFALLLRFRTRPSPRTDSPRTR